MFQKNLILVVILLTLPVFQSSSLAANGLIGSAAPYFRVQSGDDRELTLDMIKGKVAAIFYENKDIVGANQRLKDDLKRLYDEQADAFGEAGVALLSQELQDVVQEIRIAVVGHVVLDVGCVCDTPTGNQCGPPSTSFSRAAPLHPSGVRRREARYARPLTTEGTDRRDAELRGRCLGCGRTRARWSPRTSA